jgi:hypothetical protein
MGPIDYKGMAQGLLQPVIFDPWNQKKSLGPAAATEGAMPMKSGGTGINQGYRPIGKGAPGTAYGGGFKIKQNKWSDSIEASKRRPSEGIQTDFVLYKTPGGRLESSVSFNSLKQGRPSYDYGEHGGGSMRQTLKRLNAVMGDVHQFVSKVKPQSIEFEAASLNLQRLYDKVAPRMAEQLGGRLQMTRDGQYRIDFPDAAAYPLKNK